MGTDFRMAVSRLDDPLKPVRKWVDQLQEHWRTVFTAASMRAMPVLETVADTPPHQLLRPGLASDRLRQVTRERRRDAESARPRRAAPRPGCGHKLRFQQQKQTEMAHRDL
jgi:hypothetical protein